MNYEPFYFITRGSGEHNRLLSRHLGSLHDAVHRLHPGGDDGLHHHHRDREAGVRGEHAEDAGAPGSDPGAAQAGRDAQEVGRARR